MNWEELSKKTVRRADNVETFSVVRNPRSDDMGWPYLRRDHNRLSWNDRPIFRLCTIAMIAVVWATLIFIIGFGISGANTQSSEETTIHWSENGERLSQTFIPTDTFSSDIFWLSSTVGATTTIGWQISETEKGIFLFTPDSGWMVGKAGDVDLNGNVDIFDAIRVLRIIVGLE